MGAYAITIARFLVHSFVAVSNVLSILVDSVYSDLTHVILPSGN